MIELAIKKQHDVDSNFFPLWRIFPSIITLFALCLGLNSIRLTFSNKWEGAVLSVVGAAFLDGLDGRVARLLGCASMFGAQLDSLADFLNFGVAPALLIYFLFLIKIKMLGWSLVTIFVICMAIRLARFNTKIACNDHSHSRWRGNFFYGVPAPAGAILLMLPAMLGFKEIGHDYVGRFVECYYVVGYMAIVSLLTVSYVPTFSLKKLRIHKKLISPLLMVFGVIAVGIVLKPWATIPILTALYVFSIPFSIICYYYLEYKEK